MNVSNYGQGSTQAGLGHRTSDEQELSGAFVTGVPQSHWLPGPGTAPTRQLPQKLHGHSRLVHHLQAARGHHPVDGYGYQ